MFFPHKKKLTYFVRELLCDDWKACGQEAGIADSLDRPDDEAEDDEGRSVVDAIQKSEQDRTCSGHENPGIKNPGKTLKNFIIRKYNIANNIIMFLKQHRKKNLFECID